MRYFRVCPRGNASDMTLTLCEVDEHGRVHRQADLAAEGARFVPEDMLVRRAVALDELGADPGVDELDASGFEHLWRGLEPSRSFRSRLPDPERAWRGRVRGAAGPAELVWLPDGAAPAGFRRVPGFSHLYARGDEEAARRAQADVFLERPIRWRACGHAERPGLTPPR